MFDRKKFWSRARELRRKFPSCYPVRIRIVSANSIKGHYGLTIAYAVNGDLKSCVIKLADTMDLSTALDTLAEEWAHALRYHLFKVHDGKNGHDQIYGAIFNKIKEEWLHDDDDDDE